jgi:KDO II ethanolaminephosphotransferase
VRKKLEITNLSFFIFSSISFLALNLYAWKNPLLEILSASWVMFAFFSIYSVFTFTPKLQKIVFSVLWLLTIIVIFFKKAFGINFGMEVALSSLQTIHEPNVGIELLNAKFVLWLLLIGVMPVLFVVFCLKIKKINSRKLFFIISAFLIFSGLFVFIKLTLIKGYVVKEVESISVGVSSTVTFTPMDFFYFLSKANKVLKKQSKIMNDPNFIFLSKHYKYFRETDEDVKIIFVMGETARGDRFGINGYARNTTPNLEKLNKRLFFNFSNVTACNTFTVGSTKCITSRETFATYKDIQTESSFSDVLKSLGFKIKVFSMQSMYDFYGYLHYDKLVSSYEIMSQNKHLTLVSDEALLPFIESELQSDARELIFVHSQGSHIKYSLRYPEEFEKWTPACNGVVDSCNLKELSNAYDNSILYTDFFLNEVITLASKTKAIVFYTSDHGESIGENGIFGHAANRFTAPKEQLDVPFFIYISPEFVKTKQGEKVQKALAKAVKNAKNVSHDNIFHTLLSCIGVKNEVNEKPLIDETLDLCKGVN